MGRRWAGIALLVLAICSTSIQAAGVAQGQGQDGILLTGARVTVCREVLDESACGGAGDSYVLVVGAQVYRVTNQEFDGLAALNGQTVNVGGYVAGAATDTIVITKIERARS